MPALNRTLNHLQVLMSRSAFFTRVAVKLSNQCRMIINYHISPHDFHLSSNGEAWLVEMLAPRCSKYVDIGANVGQWTDLVLRFAPPVREVVLFEPAESAMRILKRRFSQITDIKLIEKAVGDAVGNLEFFEEPDAGITSSALAEFSNNQAMRRNVPITTLDSEVKEIGWDKVDFLKIDTEGYDFKVIRGASNLLSEQRLASCSLNTTSPGRMWVPR